ncbi:MAG: gamma-glutamylcyclotransferase [Deltaproteobacteria bacterium]|nr:gamma-glutamylcyclotransferase [Deltaproteobacteria bacterium]
MSLHVFTYGSLMFHRVWSKVVGGMHEKVGARLYGYKRRKIRGEIYPTVLPGTSRDYVDGIIYLNVSKSDVKTLDAFEGEYYQKEMVECGLTDGRTITAWVYVFKERYRDLVEDEPWDPVWFSEDGIHSFFDRYEGFN